MFAKTLLALLCTVAAVNSASADVVFKLQETFQWGAKFDGKVTLSDDLTDVTAVSGLLTGGGHYADTNINWVWFDGAGTSSQGLGNDTYYEFLMGGAYPAYTNFLSFTWQVIGGSKVVLSDANNGNSVNYFDTAVTASISRETELPEPASLALLGLGLAGMAARRRKQ